MARERIRWRSILGSIVAGLGVPCRGFVNSAAFPAWYNDDSACVVVVRRIANVATMRFGTANHVVWITMCLHQALGGDVRNRCRESTSETAHAHDSDQRWLG